MTVIWTLPGTFGHQQTSGAELGGAAAQQSNNFFVEVALRSIASSQLSYSLAMRKIIFDPQAPRDWRWTDLRKSDYYPLK
jgi:hypothetical protein